VTADSSAAAAAAAALPKGSAAAARHTTRPFTAPVPLSRPPLLFGLAGAVILITIGLYAVLSVSVTTQVTSDGLLVPGGSVQPVVSLTGGQLSELAVNAGDQVAAGQVVGQMFVASGAIDPIVSPWAGQVLQTAVRAGEVVSAGDLLMFLSDPQQPVVVTTFVRAEDAIAIRSGQSARVVPLNGGTNSPAYVSGTVAGVDPLPVSPARLSQARALAPVEASSQVGGNSQSSPLREVTVSFPGDPTSTDQLTWVGVPPTNDPFAEGSVVKVEIVTGEESVLGLLRSGS
jgi:multidrug efflux pump subunit AcrA (membrane-fusion protein)